MYMSDAFNVAWNLLKAKVSGTLDGQEFIIPGVWEPDTRDTPEHLREGESFNPNEYSSWVSGNPEGRSYVPNFRHHTGDDAEFDKNIRELTEQEFMRQGREHGFEPAHQWGRQGMKDLFRDFDIESKYPRLPTESWDDPLPEDNVDIGHGKASILHTRAQPPKPEQTHSIFGSSGNKYDMYRDMPLESRLATRQRKNRPLDRQTVARIMSEQVMDKESGQPKTNFWDEKTGRTAGMHPLNIYADDRFPSISSDYQYGTPQERAEMLDDLKGTPAAKLLPILVSQRDKAKPHWADREFGEF